MATHAGRARAPKKSLTEHVATQREFLKTELQPALDAAVAGTGHVFFVDAAHFVYGTFLCCLWCIARICVRAPVSFTLNSRRTDKFRSATAESLSLSF